VPVVCVRRVTSSGAAVPESLEGDHVGTPTSARARHDVCRVWSGAERRERRPADDALPLDRFPRRSLTEGAVMPVGAPRSRSGRRTGWILHRTTEPRHSRRADRRIPAVAAAGWRSQPNRPSPDSCRDAQRTLRRPTRCAGGDPLPARPSRPTGTAGSIPPSCDTSRWRGPSHKNRSSRADRRPGTSSCLARSGPNILRSSRHRRPAWHRSCGVTRRPTGGLSAACRGAGQAGRFKLQSGGCAGPRARVVNLRNSRR